MHITQFQRDIHELFLGNIHSVVGDTDLLGLGGVAHLLALIQLRGRRASDAVDNAEIASFGGLGIAPNTDVVHTTHGVAFITLMNTPLTETHTFQGSGLAGIPLAVVEGLLKSTRNGYSQGDIHMQGGVVTILLLETEVEIGVVLILTQIHHKVLAVVIRNDGTVVDLVILQTDDTTVDRPLNVEEDRLVFGFLGHQNDVEIAVLAEKLAVAINGQEQTVVHSFHATQ